MLQKNNRDKILELFLQSPTEEFQLREISRLVKVSPPSTKTYLKELQKSTLIVKKIPKSTYPSYKANRDSEYFKLVKRLHIQEKLFLVINSIDDELQPECIILFGSCSKGEDTEESDIDLFVQSFAKPKNIRKFEKKLNKKIHITNEEEFQKLSPELKNNILNGILLKGYVTVWD